MTRDGPETRETTVRCPEGHLELTVRTTGAVLEPDLREVDPLSVNPPDPPRPTVTPEDVLEIGTGDGCPLCGGDLVFNHD